ncbi:uncharacterized protein LOC119657990 isoform X2 [Hermetia illucens]|uniref:uncharacterized protein LOC119657990 isoform X2 n=1 Tax=Hermetia illucens TaxID=343691 RepID=UPI0018CC2C6C|nr:uncharacterized protein LOC119657990 isoform X2 [Hermetia illucens]
MPLTARYNSDKLAPDIYATLRKMQKFMVVKKYNVERPEIQPEPAKVKMSGYLKKKRSKMGGWRKMWFVLQNHLLLSYPTKEEYDKGLGTFKDVLNLVPGTQVRPLGGFRFTIETTTNTIYTFRCDDSKTCTGWITALLESLSIKPEPKPKETIVEKIPKFHTSLNDISEVEPKEVVRTSTSCESIYQIKNDTLNPKSPKIPIAQNTARILERNGVPTKKMSKLQQIDEEVESPKRARNFRLHERSHSVNQSDEVSRINQMFRRSISTSVLNRRPESSSRSGGSQSSSSASSPFEEPSARSKLISNVLLVKQLQQHYKRMKSVNDATTTTTASSENNSVNSERKYKCKRCCNKGHKRDHNQNNMIADCDRTLENDVQRLSLNDKSAYDSTTMHNGENDAMKDLPTSSPRRRRRQCPNHSPFHHQHHHCRHHYHGVDDGGFDPDTGVDADNEDADGDGMFVANSDGRDIMMSGTPRLSLSSDNVNRLEPIYAVVDLKNKYAHRAKMRQLEEQMERERPKSVHVVSSDYEEVLNFSHESEEEDDDSENIYEPKRFNNVKPYGGIFQNLISKH